MISIFYIKALSQDCVVIDMNMEITQSKLQQKKEKVKRFFRGVFSRKKKEEAPLVLAQEKKPSITSEETFPVISTFLKKYGITDDEHKQSFGSIRKVLEKSLSMSRLAAYKRKCKLTGKAYFEDDPIDDLPLSFRASSYNIDMICDKIVAQIIEKYGITSEELQYVRNDHPNYVWAMMPFALDFPEYLEGFGKASKEEREHYVQGKREAAKIASYRATVIDALKKYELSPLYDDAIMPVCANHALSNEEISEAIGFYKVFAALALPKQLSIAEHIEEYSNSVLGKKPIEVEHVQNKKNE